MNIKRVLLLGLWLSIAPFITTQWANGCIALSPNGTVGINDESAVIIWDKTHQTEHFIRSATFDSKHANIGFLVPTPTTPELAEADSRIFDLAEEYLPITVTDSASTYSVVEPNSIPVASVVIVAEKDIGDYHAVTLAATDSKGLGDWLKKNGYQWTASSAKWLAPYLADKWKITAFKIRRTSSGELKTNAIRMSFNTDRPFFPYSEPQTSKLKGEHRELRVAILSGERMVGKLADGSAWAGHLDFAGSTKLPLFSHADKNDWLKYAKLNDHPEIKLPSHLTYFTDDSNPRPGKLDIFFSTSPDQSNYSP